MFFPIVPNMCPWCVEPDTSSNWPQNSEEASKTAKEESQKREEKKADGEAGSEKAEEQKPGCEEDGKDANNKASTDPSQRTKQSMTRKSKKKE